MKKILCLTEASYLSSGYANYSREVLSRLHNSGQYDVAELSAFVNPNDPRYSSVDWKMFTTTPSNEAELAEFNSSVFNRFGKWKFEETVIKFQPDIVFCITDPWMFDFALESPLRRFYKMYIMPTVDAVPQKQEWIELYKLADGVLTYTDWAQNVLKEAGIKNLMGIAPPGIDKNTFYPTPNKKQHKDNMGLSPDSIIIGTVMRNQRRKLFPDLLQMFDALIDTLPAKQAENTFMHWHTAYPDIGWPINEILLTSKHPNKVLFTYKCENCNETHLSFFTDIRKQCPKCKQYTAFLPNSSNGISNADLNKIYNCYDVYVQYAALEGIGIPQIEATACGVQCASVNYSGMVDIINKLNARPIEPLAYITECESLRKWAVPNPQSAIDNIIHIINNPINPYYLNSLAVKHYNYDNVASKWASIFNSAGKSIPYNSSPNIRAPIQFESIPAMNNQDFVTTCYRQVAHRPDLINSFTYYNSIKYLNWGVAPAGFSCGKLFNESSIMSDDNKFRHYSREYVYQECLALLQFNNKWEQIRCKYCT